MSSCLLVDDSKLLRTLERQIMSGLGYDDIFEAGNGQQAVDFCKSRMPELVLLDWHMPVMDGIEFVKQLRSMPGGSSPKVIFCTTESEPGNIMLALSSGADEYVMKPFDADIIKGKLQHVGLLE